MIDSTQIMQDIPTRVINPPPPKALPASPGPISSIPPGITPASPTVKPVAAKSILDLTKYAVPAKDPALNTQTWEKRADGSSKGNGFLGLLKRPDGKVSSEISVGVNIGGKEVEIPTIVPTLTQQELDYLLTNPVGDGHPIPPSIIQKAVAHAKERIAAGKSPFAEPGESP